jgi:RNA recognition motif-containing protein
MDVKLNVGNLAATVTAHQLEVLFSQAGTVVAVQLHGDSDRADSKRSAQVTMASRAAAQKAIDQLHRTELAGNELAVSFAPVRNVAAGSQGQLSAFDQSNRSGQGKPRKPGQSRGGYQSSLGAFGSGKSAPTPPRRRGGTQHR